MPQQSPRISTCKRLDDFCREALQKCLLRAFIVLGKKDSKLECKRKNSFLQDPCVSHVCNRMHDANIEKVRSYLGRRLPVEERQKVLEGIMIALSTPEFDEKAIHECKTEEFYKLYSDLEYRIKALDVVARSEDMSHIVHNYLKCLLFSNITKLDFSEIYALGTCWRAKGHRLLFSWETYKGLAQQVEDREELLHYKQLDNYWRALVLDHVQSVGAGALKSAPYFHRLVFLNVDHVVSGPLIWAIGCHCPKLEELSMFINTTCRGRFTSFFEEDIITGLTALYGHKKFTETSFPGKPRGCPRLERVILPLVSNHREMERVAAKMLWYLPKIKELINVGLPAVFANLLQDKGFKRRPLALTHIDEGEAGDRMEEVCDYFTVDMRYFFPNVTKVKMQYTKFDGNMKMLSNFPKLNIIEIKVTDKLSEFEFGPYCTHLTHIRSDCRWDEKKLVGLSQRSPNLEIFFLVDGSFTKQKKSRDTMIFPKLRAIKIRSPMHFEPEPFISLAKSTKCLTFLMIEGEDTAEKYSIFHSFSDKAILAIAPALRRLKCFHLRVLKFTDTCRFAITEKGFYTVLNGCPDLVEIGNIFHWNIPYKDALALKQKAREKNWGAIIIPSENV